MGHELKLLFSMFIIRDFDYQKTDKNMQKSNKMYDKQRKTTIQR